MPELPEVETARAAIERAGLHRTIVEVDDSDRYVCRPHAPGELREALRGHQLSAAHRRGKTLWCDTSRNGPTLGLHLGMAGRIVITGSDGEIVTGGDPRGRYGPQSADDKPEWFRFTLTFESGATLRLFDKRRLGRVRLDPDLDALGPDAAEVRLPEFRRLIGTGRAPVKARLLDQSMIAGVGNLLADETLWQAGLDPRRRVDDLDDDEVAELHRALRRATGPPYAREACTPGRSSASASRDATVPAAGRRCDAAPSAGAPPGGAPPTNADRCCTPMAPPPHRSRLSRSPALLA